MATLVSNTISQGSMKVRWGEPYASEGINRQVSALPSGIYRGFTMATLATPGTGFRLVMDGGSGIFQDSMLVTKDEANGFGSVVREGSDITFDLTTALSWPISPAVELYVWATVTYSVSSLTVGTYYVTDTAPPDDAIVFGRVSLSGGETSIESSDLVLTGRSVPEPTQKEDGAYVAGDKIYGLLSGEESWNIPTSDQKRGLDAAATAITAANPVVTKAETLDKAMAQPMVYLHTMTSTSDKFQLSGWFYIGQGSAGTADTYFDSLLIISSSKEYADYDAVTGREILSVLYRSDGVTPINPATDNTNGFYQNPYVAFATISGSYDKTIGSLIRMRCSQLSDFSSLPTSSLPRSMADKAGRGGVIGTPFVTASPDSLTSWNVSGQLVELLDHVNDRMTERPSVFGDGWQLLWRNRVCTDSDVDRNTISIYFTTTNTYPSFAMVRGGYLNTAGSASTSFYTGTAMTGPATFAIMSNGDFLSGSKATTSSSSIYSMILDSHWDSFTMSGVQDLFKTGGDFSIVCDEFSVTGTDFLFKLPGSGDSDTYKLIFRDTLDFFKIYYKESYNSATSGLWFVYNAEWDEAQNRWECENGSYNSFALGVNRYGLVLNRKDLSDAGHGPGDGWSEGSWTSTYELGTSGSEGAGSTDAISCFNITGDMYERVAIGMYWGNNWTLTQDNGGSVLWQNGNFRNRRASGSSSFTVVESSSSNAITPTVYSASEVDNWGFRVMSYYDTNPVPAGNEWDWNGAVDVFD